MPTVEFEFDEFIRLLGKDYSPKLLEEKIPMLGVDLECIDSEKIVVEVFPNRPDMLSVEGFVCALKGKLGLESGLVQPAVADSGVVLEVDPSVYPVRPFIYAAVIRGLCLDEPVLKSLMAIQEKLHITHGRKRKKVAIGVHDLQKVTPPFKYCAVEPNSVSFVPLEMDVSLTLEQILEKNPKGRKFASIIEGVQNYPILSDSKGKVLSFPPIINSELSKVTPETTDIFIDVTGTDENAVSQALNILVCSLSERGGEVFSVQIISPCKR